MLKKEKSDSNNKSLQKTQSPLEEEIEVFQRANHLVPYPREEW